MFSQVSVCGTPPGTRGRHPLWADTPLWGDTPQAEPPPPPQCMRGYGQQAGGTHPTGMHSSIFFKFWSFSRKKNTGTKDEAPVTLISGPSGCGKSSACETLATRLNVHIMKVKIVYLLISNIFLCEVLHRRLHFRMFMESLCGQQR